VNISSGGEGTNMPKHPKDVGKGGGMEGGLRVGSGWGGKGGGGGGGGRGGVGRSRGIGGWA